jgi:hypothetical protein
MDELGLLEPVPIKDELCTAGLVRIDDLGFGARFVLANKETCSEDGSEQRIVVIKAVLTWDAIWAGLWMTWSFMAHRFRSLPGVSLFVRAWGHRNT